jgi:hypothetical protein
MRITVFTLAVLLVTATAAPAGMVVTLSPTPETKGKVSLTDTAIQVTTVSPINIDLSDVLEADFSDAPFHLDFFTSAGTTGTALPPGWQAQQIGSVTTPGSVTYADGTFHLTGNGAPVTEQAQGRVRDYDFFFVGQPWAGNGQWTAHLAQIDPTTPQAVGGLMLLESFDPGAPLFAAYGRSSGFGGTETRFDAGKNVQGNDNFPLYLPGWLRVTRYGQSISTSTSSDGKDWPEIGEVQFRIGSAQPWIGLFVDSKTGGRPGKIVVDQVSLTPAPCTAVVTPPGVILQSGSFLAGSFQRFSLAPDAPEEDPVFSRGTSLVTIPRAKIGVVTILPTSRDQLAAAGSQIGLLMKNSDFMTGDLQSIVRGTVNITSEILGPVVYSHAEVRACLLQPLRPQPAPYEVRLKDGSVIRATGVQTQDKEIDIQEISGVTVTVAPEEIAEFRAGPAQAQSLLEFPWSATPLSGAAGVPPGAGAAPSSPSVECWQGNNAEEILAVPAGIAASFPLTGRFSGMSVRIALASGAAPNAQATIRILADGRDIGDTPPFKAGEEPRSLRVTLPQPASLAFQIESTSPGTKVLFIDPLLIRAH